MGTEERSWGWQGRMEWRHREGVGKERTNGDRRRVLVRGERGSERSGEMTSTTTGEVQGCDEWSSWGIGQVMSQDSRHCGHCDPDLL